MPDKRLLRAVKRNDCEDVEQIFHDFGIPLYDESDPIISDDHLIFNFNSYQMFELLIKNGYPLHFRSTNNTTIYTIMLDTLALKQIECLLKHGQKVDSVITGLNEYRNISPLHYMIIKLKNMSHSVRPSEWIHIKQIIKLLISNGHPIDALDRKNRTPLHYLFSKRGKSAYMSNLIGFKVIKLLLKCGANPLLKDTYGYGQKPSDYIRKKSNHKSHFTPLFNAEKKKITLFELVLQDMDDDFKPVYKKQRIK